MPFIFWKYPWNSRLRAITKYSLKFHQFSTLEKILAWTVRPFTFQQDCRDFLSRKRMCRIESSHQTVEISASLARKEWNGAKTMLAEPEGQAWLTWCPQTVKITSSDTITAESNPHTGCHRWVGGQQWQKWRWLDKGPQEDGFQSGRVLGKSCIWGKALPLGLLTEDICW